MHEELHVLLKKKYTPQIQVERIWIKVLELYTHSPAKLRSAQFLIQ